MGKYAGKIGKHRIRNTTVPIQSREKKLICSNLEKKLGNFKYNFKVKNNMK